MSVVAPIPESYPIKEIRLDYPQQKIFDGRPFPLVLVPKGTALQRIGEASEWIRNQKSDVEDLLFQYGAILFRGFPIDSPECFDVFVKAFGYGPLPYIGGAAPRNIVVGDVFTANEAPPNQQILFHHEMSQVPVFPSVVFFHCDTEPGSGGQTSLALSNEVYRRMLREEKEFVEKVEDEGVRYKRTLPDGDDSTSAIGRGWQGTYQTQDRTEAERKCREYGTSFEWLENGCMKTTTATCAAVREDPRTGKKMWFNQIQTAYLAWEDSRNEVKKSVVFPDDSQMPPDAMETLGRVLEDVAIDFNWRKGDIIMIDNKTVLHARRPFTPPRRVLACLCK